MGVCSAIRRRLRAGGAPKRIKVGHCGTLDPRATGVLVVMVGKATKHCQSLMGTLKCYRTEIDLLHISTTDDLEGDLVEVSVFRAPSLEEINEACNKLVGTIMQTPPAYSAMKVGGQRAYKLAREGKKVHLEPRPVVIDSIEVLSYAWPMLTLDIVCGKGTYIRSLGRDIGASLGAGGVLTALRRTAVGSYTIDQATPLDDLPDQLEQSDLMPIQLDQ